MCIERRVTAELAPSAKRGVGATGCFKPNPDFRAGEVVRIYSRCGRPLLVAAVAFCLSFSAARADDLYWMQKAELQQIKQRMVDEFTFRGASDSPAVREQVMAMDARVDQWLAQPGGYWAQWADARNPQISMQALAFGVPAELARAYATPSSRHYHDRRVLAAAEDGLKHLEKFVYPGCPQPANWWTWQIGIPMQLTTTLLLLEGAMDKELFAREVATVTFLLKLEDDVKRVGSFIAPHEAFIGQTDMNAFWRSRIRMTFGVLLENPLLAGQWARTAAGEMGSPGAGFLQADWSYKFHGDKPMWAYGRSFLSEYAMMLGQCADTFLSPSPEEIDRYAGMLEHFVNGFLYRGQLSPSLIGREISRGTAENAAVPSMLAVLAKVPNPRAAEFARLYAREVRLIDSSPAWKSPTGEPNRRWGGRPPVPAINVPAAEPAPPVDDIFAYPDAEFLQITRPDWAVGIRLHSRRNAGYESINGENLQGWFLSHGSTFHYLTGAEWDDCWPAIDWTRLPGTTVASEVKKQNESAFSGVLRGSQRVALAALELKREGFTANKSWLVDGDALVCLGSAISGPGRVETTVANQPVAADAEVLIDGQPAPAEPFDQTRTVQSVWLANMGYVFPGGAKVHVIREVRTADWSSIRKAATFGAGASVTRHFVTVVLPHDAETRGYQYIMLPNVSRAAWAALAQAALARFELQSNDAHIVRTRDGRVAAVVLWADGEVGGVRADRGCMALNVNGAWQVVDPAWDARPLTVSVNGRPHTLNLAKGRPERLDP